MTTSQNYRNVPGSFRDPSGFLFHYNGEIYRQVNTVYRENYDLLMTSGLYHELARDELLIPHEEVGDVTPPADKCYKLIRPKPIPFISYPYEWSFSQLRAAALLTLEIQKRALAFGMSLRDSSAYNIQFQQGKPILIDTLSFEEYQEGEPWIAYRQFCQHFLAPLALMSYTDIRLNQLLRIYIDGIPLDLVNSLLPFRSRLHLSLFTHIFLHARSQRRFADKEVDSGGRTMSRLSFRGLIDNLESAVRKLTWKKCRTEWGDYYEDTNYSPTALGHKKEIIEEFLDRVKPGFVWDLGANIGLFSRVASGRGIPTISFDIDPAAVEKNYLQTVKTGETNLLPLLLDLANPSPGLGWENRERNSLIERGPVEMVFALALIHHLAISNNLPLIKVAEFLSSICAYLVIEFVPKEDSQVKRLLSSREDIFPDYNQENFESEFGQYFTIEDSVEINDSHRRLYLMRRR